MKNLFNSLTTEMCSEHRQRKDCAIVAVSIVAGISYNESASLLRYVGKKDNKGTATLDIIDALKLIGCSIRMDKAALQDWVRTLNYTYGKNLKSVTAGHPGKYKHIDWTLGGTSTKQLWFSRGHVAAMVDGKIHDWSENRANRIFLVGHVTVPTEVNLPDAVIRDSKIVRTYNHPVKKQRETTGATKSDFRIGDNVSFTNRRKETVIGKIVKTNPKNAKVLTSYGSKWNVPYDMLKMHDGNVPGVEVKPKPSYPMTGVALGVGSRVQFGRENGRKQCGKIVKVNRKTYKILSDNNTLWNVTKSLAKAI